MGFLIGSFWLFGIFGVLITPFLIFCVTYPLQQFYLARFKGTDLLRDAMFMAVCLVVVGVAIEYNWESLVEFYRTSRALAPAVTGNWHPESIFAP